MYSTSKIVALILSFCLGFATCAGMLVGGIYVALTEFKVRDLETYGLADIPDELVFGENPQVDLLNLSALEMVDEMQKLTALGDGLTINLLQTRYDLKIDKSFDMLLTDEVRNIPLKKLFSEKGIKDLLSTLYIGYILKYECVDIATGAPADPELGDELTKWYNPKAQADVVGIQAYLSYISIGDFINGELDVNSLVGGIVIGDALGYTYDEANGYWKDANNEQVVGVMAAFAGMKVTEVGTNINSMKIGTLLGYTEKADGWYTADEQGNESKVSGVVATLADCELDQVGSKLNDVTVGELLGYDLDNGVWYEIDEDGNKHKLTGIMKVLAPAKLDEVGNKINGSCLGELLGYELIKGEWYQQNDETEEFDVKVTGIMGVLAPSKINDVGDTINKTNLGNLLGYEMIDGEWYQQNELTGMYDVKLTGIMSVLAPSNINEVGNTINGSSLGKLLGYEEIEGQWYQQNEESGEFDIKVTGIMSVLAPSNMSDVGSAISDITIGDVVEEESRNGIFAILDPETPINNIAGAINDSIMGSPLQFFINEGLVEFDKDTQSYLDLMSAYKNSYELISEDDPNFADYYEGHGDWVKVGNYYKIPAWRTKPLSGAFGHIVNLLMSY